MSTVRAKFVVQLVSDREDGAKQIKLAPVTSGSAENEQFFKYTPYGSIDIGTVNAEAAAKFTQGQEFYVDFTPAD